MALTDDRDDPGLKKIEPDTGMQENYLVLSEAERAKGFVRPLRTSYRHVGVRPTNPTRELTEEEQEHYGRFGYVLFEEYPEGSAARGRFWTEAQLNSGCGSITHMAIGLAETYARQPDFYGGTYCAHCRTHFDVGAHGEFVWTGTEERVGT